MVCLYDVTVVGGWIWILTLKYTLDKSVVAQMRADCAEICDETMRVSCAYVINDNDQCYNSIYNEL